jgi:5-(carboxyamino)imidazole ribonucleotide synthase
MTSLKPAHILKPGSTIGILGGGQLGRMLTLAAAPLGYKCKIYCPDPDSPAFQVSDSHVIAPYEDKKQLMAFADSVDVITYEFENIPVETAKEMTTHSALYPSAKALEISQDRLTEKNFLNNINATTAPYVDIKSKKDLVKAVEEFGLPAILKTRRFGYDGKGQVAINRLEDIPSAFRAMNGAPAILEAFIDFTREISVVVARSQSGEVRCYPVCENIHRNHILDETHVPAHIGEKLQTKAEVTAQKIIGELDYVGVMAVEMFVTNNETEILVNEIAPRVHNSGHWTQDGAVTCQFEQHIRAICGLPLGSTDLLGKVRMKNLVGTTDKEAQAFLKDAMAHLHLYGKSETREGRKMGHVTWVRKD